MTEAGALFERFYREIAWAVRQVARMLPDRGAMDIDDIRQEALISVATYAGLMPGWHSGKLAKWEALADEREVRRLLCATLRSDLAQTIGRKLAPEIALPLGELVPSQEPSSAFEAALMASLAREAGIREAYPYLCRSVLDGLTEPQIASEAGVSVRTAKRRLAAERLAFAGMGLAALCTRCASLPAELAA